MLGKSADFLKDLYPVLLASTIQTVAMETFPAAAAVAAAAASEEAAAPSGAELWPEERQV